MAYKVWSSDRLTFRAVEEADEPFLLALEDRAVDRMNSTLSLPTPLGHNYAVFMRGVMETSPLGVVICLTPSSSTATAIPIGTIGLFSDDDSPQHHRNAHLGLSLHPEYQGKGYGSEAIRWATNWGFRHANLHRIEIEAFGYNPGALRLYRRLGFKEEVRLRDALWHNGRYHDSTVLSMLASEWRPEDARVISCKSLSQ